MEVKSRQLPIWLIAVFLVGFYVFTLLVGMTPFSGPNQWRGFLFAWGIALMIGSLAWRPFITLIANVNKRYPKVSLVFRLWFETYPWVLLIPLPFLISFLNDNLFYANDGHSDPWLYFGLFHWFERHVEYIPDTYYPTRIPAIIPGYFFYNLFPPVVAHWCNSLLFYYLSVFSLYGIVKKIQGLVAGLLIAFLLGTFNMFLGLGSTNFVTTPAIAFTLLSMYFSVRTINDPMNISAVAAGFFGILAVWSNLAFLVYIPCLILFNLWALLRSNKTSTQAFVNWASRFLIGVLLATGLCSLVNIFIADGRTLFFIEHFSYLLDGYDKIRWRYANFSYIESAPLVLPTACTLGIIISLILHPIPWKTSIFSKDFPAILFVFFAIEMIILEFYGGYNNLQQSYHSAAYIPLLFTALGCFLNFENSFRVKNEISRTLPLLGIAYFAVVMPYGWPGHKVLLSLGQFGLPLLLAIAGIVLHRINVIRSASVVLALIFVSQLGAIPDHLGRDLWFALPRHTSINLYDRVHRGIQFVLSKTTDYPRFWYNRSENILDFIALQRSFLEIKILDLAFPKVPPEGFREKQTIILLSKHGNLVQRATKSLAKQGLGIEVLGSEWITRHDVRYEIVAAQIKKETKKTQTSETLSLIYDPAKMRIVLEPDSGSNPRSRVHSFLKVAKIYNVHINTGESIPIGISPYKNISMLAEVHRAGDYLFLFRVRIVRGGILATIRMSPGREIRAAQSVSHRASDSVEIELITFLNAGKNIRISLDNAIGHENSSFILEDFRIERY